MTMSGRRSSTQRGAVAGGRRGLTPGERGDPPYPKLVGGSEGVVNLSAFSPNSVS